MIRKTFRILILFLVHQVLSSSETSDKGQTNSSQSKNAALETKKNTDERISQIKCNEYADKVKCPIPVDDVNFDNIFVEDARSVDFPHMALILEKGKNGELIERCDGTLVSSRFILTAAHCSETIPIPADPINAKPGKPVDLVARLGDHIRNYSAFDGVNQIQVPVKKVHKHPKYTTPYAYHDMGLLELAQDVKFTEYIRPACLWNSQQFSTQRAPVTSYTAYNRYLLENSTELQKFHTYIITNNECKAKGHGGIGETQICTVHRTGINDTHCIQFAGAPLQIMATHNPCVSQVIGVTSFGTLVCGHQPAVFARISSYLDWIEQTVWPESV